MTIVALGDEMLPEGIQRSKWTRILLGRESRAAYPLQFAALNKLFLF